jgi:hypothetical protein
MSPTFERTFSERFKPETLWNCIQDGGELKFPPDYEKRAGCLVGMIARHIWLLMFVGALGFIIADWQQFGLDLRGLLSALVVLFLLTLFRWEMFVAANYQLVLRVSGADIVAEERLVKVWKNTIRLKDWHDAVPAPKGGVIISSKNGQQLLIGKHLGPQHSMVVADFFKFSIGQMEAPSVKGAGGEGDNEQRRKG